MKEAIPFKVIRAGAPREGKTAPRATEININKPAGLHRRLIDRDEAGTILQIEDHIVLGKCRNETKTVKYHPQGEKKGVIASSQTRTEMFVRLFGRISVITETKEYDTEGNKTSNITTYEQFNHKGNKDWLNRYTDKFDLEGNKTDSITDNEKFNSKGIRIKFKTKHEKYDSDGIKAWSKEVTEKFDKKGRRTWSKSRIVPFYEQGNPTQLKTDIYHFDSKGNKTRKKMIDVVFDPETKTRTESIITTQDYDSSGNIMNSDSITYEFNSKKKIPTSYIRETAIFHPRLMRWAKTETIETRDFDSQGKKKQSKSIQRYIDRSGFVIRSLTTTSDFDSDGNKVKVQTENERLESLGGTVELTTITTLFDPETGADLRSVIEDKDPKSRQVIQREVFPAKSKKRKPKA